GFTKQGLIPCCSSTSYTGIQYTPVDSMAAVVMPQRTSHSAIWCRSPVNVSHLRTGCSSRSAGTATKISLAPMSMPAELDSNTERSGWLGCLFRLLLLIFYTMSAEVVRLQ